LKGTLDPLWVSNTDLYREIADFSEKQNPPISGTPASSPYHWHWIANHPRHYNNCIQCSPAIKALLQVDNDSAQAEDGTW